MVIQAIGYCLLRLNYLLIHRLYLLFNDELIVIAHFLKFIREFALLMLSNNNKKK